MHQFLNVFEGLLLLSPDTKAQTRPQFGFLSRRGFQSSVKTAKTSQKKSVVKTKSGHGHLPSISSRTSPKKKKSTATEKEKEEADATLRMLIRLWSHETVRVYLDRQTVSKERMWFLKLLESCVKHCFCGVGFVENAGITGKPLVRQSGTGRTVRQLRGSRIRAGSTAFQEHGALPYSNGLNAEELAASGMKVDTLKELMTRSAQRGRR